MNYAPIALFVYNRPWHTKQTIAALQNNYLASRSELFVYSDAPKNDTVNAHVAEVRTIIKNISGFKKVTVIERTTNYGLADSIISSVNEIINKYGKVIVLEDDLLTSPYFLNYMNDALAFYEEEKSVWHICGWNYPVNSESESDVLLWRVMNCWGWATWSDRWQHFERDPDHLIESFNAKDKAHFNLDGSADFFGQVIANKQGKIKTWAVFWYATIFKNNGLCLTPATTYVENIGLDGSGENSANSDLFSNKNNEAKSKYKFVTSIKEDAVFVERVKDYYMKNKRTKFQAVLYSLKKAYLKEQFNPSLIGLLINPFYFSRRALSVSIIKLLPKLGGVILDIGCGNKPYERFCQYDKYIGLELESAKENPNNKADYYYDGEKIPFNSSSMDSVITNQVFEHVFTPNVFLLEVNRVLKEGGLLLLTAPLVWAEHEQPFDYARYTSFGLKDILEKNGFEVVELTKTANDFSAVIQVLTSYLHEKTFGENQYFNFLITLFLIAPFNIVGLIASKLLPENNTFYLDNVVLAKKIKNAY